MKNTKKELSRIIRAFGFSIKGLKYCYKSEAAFRQEVLLTALLVPLVFLLTNSTHDRVFLLIPVFILLIVELINSAIEAVVDSTEKNYNKLAGAAKDMGSASVLLSSVLLITIWLIILF